ncbi:MAG: extracellular solute-binding protein, partial [Clostridia bacterium]|nr:extracellular solute-binding protein [Clostridia bacterium]
MMISMLKQLSTEGNELYSDDNGDIYIFNDTTKEILYELNAHAKSGAFSTFKISSYPANFLNAGQCIFAIDSTAGATWIGSHAPLSEIHESELVEFETVVRPLPQFDTENPKMISQGPSVCVFNKKDPGEVLASWLFAQFLITNDVQIPYSETEGYVPVTEKAQKDPQYLQYLDSRDELSKDFYSVKIDASKMLLDNIGNSFITPVFNGSTSLRDTAGELIESVVKSRRKNETVDDEYLDKLEVTVTKLYRLDQISMSPSGRRAELGPLPAGSLALLIVLACVWLLLGAYFITDKIIERRKKLQSGA